MCFCSKHALHGTLLQCITLVLENIAMIDTSFMAQSLEVCIMHGTERQKLYYCCVHYPQNVHSRHGFMLPAQKKGLKGEPEYLNISLRLPLAEAKPPSKSPQPSGLRRGRTVGSDAGRGRTKGAGKRTFARDGRPADAAPLVPLIDQIQARETTDILRRCRR